MAGSYDPVLFEALMQHIHYTVFKQVSFCVFHYSVCNHAAAGLHTGKPDCETA